MTIKVKEGRIRANSKSHGVGTVLTLDINEEKRLVDLGVAEFVEEPINEANEDSNDDEPQNKSNKKIDKMAHKNEGGPDTGHPDIK